MKENMKVLVINVLERTDRLQGIEAHLNSLDIDFEIVKAVDKYELRESENNFLPIDIERIWRSHLKCLEIASKYHNEYTMIVEDDANLAFDSIELASIVSEISKIDIGFLQIGFLKLNPIDSLSILSRNIYDSLIRKGWLEGILKRFGFLEMSRALNQPWRKQIPDRYILNDVRYGAHCYLINSKLAQKFLMANNPPFLSIDDFFVSISRMKSFRMCRLRKSLAEQNNSPTSVTKRFLQH
jgi:GR25 family glycosyltransferase involved in LPS biosynthesis